MLGSCGAVLWVPTTTTEFSPVRGDDLDCEPLHLCDAQSCCEELL